MRRILFAVLVGLVGLAVVLFIAGNLIGSTPTGNGMLTITSEPAELPVLIDDSVVGKTPLDKYTLKAGMHLIKIGDTWQENIIVAAKQESFISRDFTLGSSLVSGYAVGYEKIAGLFRDQRQMVVTSTPPGAVVISGDIELGNTPLVVSDYSNDLTKLTIRLSGYDDLTVEIIGRDGYILRVESALVANPLDNLVKVDTTNLELPAESEFVGQVSTRSDWGGPAINRDDSSSLNLIPWTKIDVFGSSIDSPITADFLRSLDLVARERYSLQGIPFAYIVTDQGSIFEGLGVFDYDFSSMDDFRTDAGIAPVLITGSARISDARVRAALGKILAIVRAAPEFSARFVSTEVQKIEIPGGESRVVDLQWVNTSSRVWDGQALEPSVVLAVKDLNKSDLYDPESWISPEQIVRPQGRYVTQGETATFSFRLKAPFYSGTYSEQYQLYSPQEKRFLENTKVELVVSVKGEAETVLIVKDTPTGFLNVRSGPGTNYQLITTVFPGDKFAWVQEQGGWFQIILRDGTKGWITNTYIEKI